MAYDMASRIRVTASQGELERRWKAVREAMQAEGLDFLLMQNFTRFHNGYIKWFTDNSRYQTVLFPRDDEMTAIMHGPWGEAPGPLGIKRQISLPSMPPLEYTLDYDAEAVVKELEGHRNLRIGLLGMGRLTASFYNYVTRHLQDSTFNNAADLIDSIKAIKSDEEIEHIRAIAALQDDTFEYACRIIKPGRRDFEAFADIVHQCMRTGSEEVNLMVGSAAPGTPIMGAHLHTGNRVMQDGDQVAMLIESNGPSGIYTEIMRTVCIGKVPPELQEQFEAALELQKITLGMLRPGADTQQIWEANNEFLRSRGYAEEKRLLMHGMGYDMVERPCVQPGETLKIEAKMNIAGHATVVSDRAIAAVCENYLVTQKGLECLHKTPKQIMVV
jgi:Xaa-Pro aminopeptidase